MNGAFQVWVQPALNDSAGVHVPGPHGGVASCASVAAASTDRSIAASRPASVEVSCAASCVASWVASRLASMAESWVASTRASGAMASRFASCAASAIASRPASGVASRVGCAASPPGEASCLPLESCGCAASCCTLVSALASISEPESPVPTLEELLEQAATRAATAVATVFAMDVRERMVMARFPFRAGMGCGRCTTCVLDAHPH